MAIATLMVAMPSESYAQGFLNKLKEKAENKLMNAIGLGSNEEEKPQEEASMEEAEEAYQQPASAAEKIPKLRQSSVVWDGQVTPSTAADYRALMNELPSLPSVEEMVNPSDIAREAYYNKLYSLSLRANELDDMYTCSDEEMVIARDKLYKEMEGITGLTAEEMVRLEDENTSQAEKDRLEQKMMDHILGGANVDDMASKAEKMEPRMKEIEVELEALNKKAEKGTLTEAEQARLQELNAEMMQMTMDMMSGMGNIMDIGAQAAKLTANLTNQFDGQLKKYTAKLSSISKDEGSVKDCEQIAKEYEAELKGIYQQIWAEEDAEKVHALYDRADELVKNYRTRAAQIYRQGLVTKLQNMKMLLPEAEQLYAEMAEDGMIPECSIKRAPLNVVIECINILESAYSDFPQPEVLPYKVKTIDLGISNIEYICNGESGYGGSFARGGIGNSGSGGAAGVAMEEDFIRNSTFLIYNSEENCYYKLNNGVRTRLEGNGPFDYYVPQKRDDSAYGAIPLRGGGRKAVYDRSGALILHDGTYCWPVAMQRNGDWLDFIMDNGGKFEVCSYKL